MVFVEAKYDGKCFVPTKAVDAKMGDRAVVWMRGTSTAQQNTVYNPCLALKKYFGKIDLDIDLDVTRDRH